MISDGAGAKCTARCEISSTLRLIASKGGELENVLRKTSKPINLYTMMRCGLRTPEVFDRPGFEPFSSLLAIASTSRRAASSLCLTLLASPDFAGGDLGRARAVPR